MTAADVAVDIISSSEFKNKNYTNEVYVRKLYAALFARSPQDSEVSNWVEVLSNGVSQKYVLKPVSYTHLDVYKRQGDDGTIGRDKTVRRDCRAVGGDRSG